MSVACSLMLLAGGIGYNVVCYNSDQVAYESSIIGLIVTSLVGIVVAGALLPTIANQSTTLAANNEIGDTEQTMIELWPLLVTVGIMVSIIAMAL